MREVGEEVEVEVEEDNRQRQLVQLITTPPGLVSRAVLIVGSHCRDARYAR